MCRFGIKCRLNAFQTAFPCLHLQRNSDCFKVNGSNMLKDDQ
ncbi:hypothetical protein NEICINOT_04477 [Neisseria cinerea ATCC 14685]|uniref:Uncharacterized protein n=1 Tax=Neisseria cinerea ATCC 14685 TaxID=546262 RepID=D0W482_NEICI|nr:hypothetical protein NEICINOT_04477 [Neisseria cinerea ATCC 14685]